jgi:hypothetical protein
MKVLVHNFTSPRLLPADDFQIHLSPSRILRLKECLTLLLVVISGQEGALSLLFSMFVQLKIAVAFFLASVSCYITNHAFIEQSNSIVDV